MFDFIIWIDGDSCPKILKDFLFRESRIKKVKICVVANREVKIPDGDFISMIVCPNVSGAADDYIFEHCKGDDVVVTRDIVFADRLIEKGIFVINDRGIVFTKDNIKDRLREREFNMNLSILGLNEKAQNRYGQKELEKFSYIFERHISQLIVNDTFKKARISN